MIFLLGFLAILEVIMFFILALKDNDGFIFIMIMYIITIIAILGLLLQEVQIMRKIGLTVGATYKSPNGDTYEVLGIFANTESFNSIPEYYYVVIKNGKEHGTIPMFADYSKWELCMGKKEQYES